MKRLFSLAGVAFLATLGILAGTAVPAQAVEPWQSDMSGNRFWSGQICVDGSAINGAYYRVGYQAQQWNTKVNANGSALWLDYEDDCAAAGYPPNRLFVIGSFNKPDVAGCILATNQNVDFHNNMFRWTNSPGWYINFAHSGCVGSQARRDHIVAATIGNALGLKFLNSSGYNSRVQNMTVWSWDNVTVPDNVSAYRVWEIMIGVYGG